MNLTLDGYDKFVHTTRWMKHHSLLYSKGIYPYEYMDGPDRFNESQLPPKSSFYSKLTENGISEEEYAKAQRI